MKQGDLTVVLLVVVVALVAYSAYVEHPGSIRARSSRHQGAERDEDRRGLAQVARTLAS